MAVDLAPFDAVLLVSFGGPEGPDDVMPFLENVTRGRGIPRERLEEVAEHYLHFGGVSPINEQCRDLLAVLEPALRSVGVDLPIYWGNRNWAPLLTDTVSRMVADGIRRPLAFTTSAYSSYSSCRQYREDLAAAFGPHAGTIEVAKVAQYFDADGFIEGNARAVIDALRDAEPATPVVFVTHSVPLTMASTSGDPARDYGSDGAYVAQHLAVGGAVIDRVATARGTAPTWSLAYCSRSGPPDQPWLEPDVSDVIHDLAAAGHRSVCLAPIGFVSDHMEVIFDLDVEAAETAAEVGVRMHRAATVGTDPAFVEGLVALLAERAAEERGEVPSAPARITVPFGRQPSTCAPGCCANPRSAKPALCGHAP